MRCVYDVSDSECDIGPLGLVGLLISSTRMGPTTMPWLFDPSSTIVYLYTRNWENLRRTVVVLRTLAKMKDRVAYDIFTIPYEPMRKESLGIIRLSTAGSCPQTIVVLVSVLVREK